MTEANLFENKDFQIRCNRAKELLEVQGKEGDCGSSEYMLGMYNGMELILSIFEDRNPCFKEKAVG